MPWRVPRRWWWCGCDGSGVRRRRVRGRRGWRGGVGCGCTSSPTGRWRSRGRRGPSRGRRARTGPALVGLARGLGGGACVGGAHGSGRCLDALVDESSGVGDGQVTWIRGRCGGPGPRGSPPSRCLRRRIACSRAPTALSAPRARAGGPADDAAGAYRPRDEGRAAEPRPGRHAGVGSAGGALPAFSRVGFRRPPSEPDVRIPAHPALHPCYAVAFAVQGLGMRVPR